MDIESLWEKIARFMKLPDMSLIIQIYHSLNACSIWRSISIGTPVFLMECEAC